MTDSKNVNRGAIIYDVCQEFGVDPDVPIESAEYFNKLLDQFEKSEEEDLGIWLKDKLSQDFVTLPGRPIWIQGAGWPFQNGLPMIFAGQINLKASEGKGYFHDDAAIFVFLPREKDSEIVTVTQVF